MKTMKAVRVDHFGGPETLTMAQVAMPRPDAGKALIRVEATSINPIDWKLREGLLDDLPLPFTPGGDFCGYIEQLGPGVQGFEKGEEVYGCAEGSIGADAEFLVCPQTHFALKPRAVGPTVAACVPLAAMTAWQGLATHGGLKPGQTVLILGASGGVGGFAVQLAKLWGAAVIGTAATENVDHVRNLGADEVVDYKRERIEDRVKNADLCLDLVGGELQKRAFACLKRGGRLVSSVQMPDELLARQSGIVASLFFMKPEAGQLRDLATKIDAGELKVEVARVLGFDQLAQAEELNRLHQVEGKIAVLVGRA